MLRARPRRGAVLRPTLDGHPRAAAGEAPLGGLRVLEFTQLMAGPEAGRLLRDHGADVIKVESRAFPDQSRVFGGAANMSSQFVTINRDKRSFGVDLKQPEGLALVLQLVAGADIVIENLGPGAMESIGLGRDALRRANRDVVIVSSQLFGDNGPWGWWRGFGTHARSVGGQTWLWRYPGTERDFAENGIFFPDQFAARLEALAALACVGRATSHHIRVAQADAVVNSLSELVLQESLEPGSVDTLGNRSPEGSPWGVYRCAGEDDWCVITVRDDRDWAALVEAIGRPPGPGPDRYATVRRPPRPRRGARRELGSLDINASGPASHEHAAAGWRPGRGRAGAGRPARRPPPPRPGLSAGDGPARVRPILVEGDCHTAAHLPKKPPGPAPRQGHTPARSPGSCSAWTTTRSNTSSIPACSNPIRPRPRADRSTINPVEMPGPKSKSITSVADGLRTCGAVSSSAVAIGRSPHPTVSTGPIGLWTLSDCRRLAATRPWPGRA